MDLTTTYLGLKLRTPLVPSASPLSEEIGNIKRMEDAGAAAVVLHSLFEEQLRLETYELNHHLTNGTESFPEALTYFPQPEAFHLGPDAYLEHIRRAKRAFINRTSTWKPWKFARTCCSARRKPYGCP